MTGKALDTGDVRRMLEQIAAKLLRKSCGLNFFTPASATRFWIIFQMAWAEGNKKT